MNNLKKKILKISLWYYWPIFNLITTLDRYLWYLSNFEHSAYWNVETYVQCAKIDIYCFLNFFKMDNGFSKKKISDSKPAISKPLLVSYIKKYISDA